MPKLILFMRKTCPYCQKVTGFIENNNIQIEKRDIENAGHKKELIEKGGKSQVPCLFIDDEPLYESDVIIDYLKQEFK